MSGKTFTIPTIYTAIDKFSAPVAKMATKAQAFGIKAEASLSRLDRKMRPIGKQAAIVGTAALAPLAFVANEARKYEDAVAGFRTIVSDLTDKDFAKYEDSIRAVGASTKATYADVAKSYERIAGLNAKFAESPDQISKVTEATIILARASRMELGPAADNLVGIMNQFSLGANDANRTINVLAAGQAVGAASIEQTSEAFVNFGSVAAGANITLEQSVALVQTLGKFSLFGAEAGTKLRGAVLKLQKAGVGYKSGQFQINDALEETRIKMSRLRTEKQKDALLNQMFGAENVTAGRILLNNIDLYKEFTAGVTNTSEAQRAAAINQATFSEKLQLVKNQALNLAVNLGEKLLPHLTALADRVIPIVENMIKWTKENPQTTKTILYVVAGIAALSYAVAAVSGAIAIGTKVMAAYNFVMGLNPVWILVTGIGLLTFGIYKMIQAQNSLTTADRVANQVRERALENTIDQRAEVTLLFAQLRKATVGTEQYASILKKIEAIQPGITKQYDLQAGAIDKINAAEKALTASIMERAMAEARAELLKEKTKELLKEQQSGPSTWDWIKGAFQGGLGGGGIPAFNATMNQTERMGKIQDEINVLADQVATDRSGPTSSKVQQEQNLNNLVQTNNASVDINLKDPGNNIQNLSSNNPFVKINTSKSKVIP